MYIIQPWYLMKDGEIMNSESNSNQVSTAQEKLEVSTQESRKAWRRLGMRIRSITPTGLARFLLVIAFFALVIWLIQVAWLALLPFVVGAIIAYILLPVVDRLDRWMPRGMAVILTMIGAFAVVVWFIILLVPALAEQIMRVYVVLPGIDELRIYADEARAYIQSLPEPTQETIDQVVERAGTSVRENLDVFLANSVNIIIASVLSVVNTIGFVLGFLIVPTWLLIVLKDQKAGVEATNRLLPNWMRADFWAVLRILDRAFRAFIGGQFLLGLVTGVAMYLGLSLIEAMGLWAFQYKLLLAMFIGFMQLIPSLGPFLGSIPAVIMAIFGTPALGLTVLALYLVILWLVSITVTPRIEGKIIDMHPAVLIVAIVALSELGYWWLFLAAPITAIIRDLFRYTYGRFSNPSRPAGLLPGEAYQPEPEAQSSIAQSSARRIPLAYRRGRAVRRSQS